ncbi:RAB7A-interacting MON1-CCZ1 complex subunit 1 [Hyla sarda]|uniref:RAB7A-interacting MON1-CCZ1 complex subunit 1 n=1 Tax=Hyla sarda TaxID=327740 RepID=UPI0024C2FB7C|nr:RAB7A-interacting MON1-CCZ1 complex subunit 1 [Hyla sarda]
MASSCSLEWTVRAGRLRRRWERLQEGGQGDAVLLKALAALQRLDERCQEGARGCDDSLCLALYSQAVLDITFYEENQLVDEDFPGDDSLQKVGELVEMLSEPENLVGESPQRNLALDIEVQECLQWRRGALLYMYCHTVGEREKWELRDPRIFRQCLQDGVYYLQKMLHKRSPVRLDDKVSFQDLNTAILLEKGIFSDIHAIALMYCGEMCYWALRYCRDVEQVSPLGTDSQTTNKVLHFKEIGEKVLGTYISVCEGPLCGQGWNTDNAKKILQYFKED